VRAILLGSKGAAEDGGGAEQAEEIGADLGGLELLGIRVAGEVDDAAAEGGDIFGDAGLLALVLELGGRAG
jgi:hypothetical protein